MTMMTTRIPILDSQVDDSIREAQADVKDRVIAIRYVVEDDWSGEPSIFFRVVLSDDASTPSNLLGSAEMVKQALKQRVKPESLGLYPYFSFRSASEQADTGDPTWI